MVSGSGAAAITACCTAKATCAVAVCGAGKKQKASASATECNGKDAASCPSITCCENDPLKCLASSVDCGNGKYKDSTKDDVTSGTDMITNCCTNDKTCADAMCGKGKKVIASNSTVKCDSHAASCKQSTCCEYDATKCGGRANAFVCTGTDIPKDGNTAGTTKEQCCMTKPTMATCEAFKTTPVASAAQKMAMSVLFAVVGVVALWK